MIPKNLWRSKEQQEVWDSFQGWMNLPTIQHSCWKHILPSVFPDKECQLGEHVLEDAGLHPEGETLKALQQTIHTESGRRILNALLEHPTTDQAILQKRIEAIQWIAQNGSKMTKVVLKLKPNEAYLAWLMATPFEPKEPSWPFQMCFPHKLPFRLVNYHSLTLDSLHLFRGFIYPAIHTFSPISSVLAPYWMIRFKLKFPMSFAFYFKTMLRIALEGIRPGLFPWKGELVKYIVVVGYILLYLYHVVQQWSHAKMIRTVRRQLNQYARQIQRFIQAMNEVTRQIPKWIWEAFGSQEIQLPSHRGHSLIGLYRLWSNPVCGKMIAHLLRNLGILDVLQSCAHKVSTYQYVLPRYDLDRATCFFGMGHPALPSRQQRNPARLSKNIIVTGPNAAGKSTYTRSILTNQILAQTLGICCAVWASVHPVGGIFSYMRIRDEVGNASLYEAELKRCSGILNVVEQSQLQGRDILCFLDEPFHSTPPIEGTATALAFVQLLGSYPNVRLVVTTHYHKMLSLEKEAPQLFQNVSMEAIEVGNRSYRFPYQLKRGPSTQCIAIELLLSHGFPNSLMESAIKWKENIYRETSNDG
jgi:hypothetical protein